MLEIKAQDIKYSSTAISKKQFDEHIKLYKGYVDKINEIDKNLNCEGSRVKANAVYSEYRGLKKGETFALDSIILHEEYFCGMTAAQTKPGPKTQALFAGQFDDIDGFLRDFTACCLSSRGWCISCFDQRSRSLRNILCDAHDQGFIAMSYPILVMDMYEHAYFTDYATDKKSYIGAFIKTINWDIVEARVNRL